MCFPSKCCCLSFLLVLVILFVGFVFGFGIFAHGFQKIKDALHESEPPGEGRPFFPTAAPPF